MGRKRAREGSGGKDAWGRGAAAKGEDGAGWRGAGGHAYVKSSEVRPVQCWATSETESSVTLVLLSGGGVVGGWGANGEEESERG